MLHRCHISPLFPYTTLFRSVVDRDLTSADHFGDGDGRVALARDGQVPAADVLLPGAVEVPGRHDDIAGKLTLDLGRSEEHTSELQSRLHLVCRLTLETNNIG